MNPIQNRFAPMNVVGSILLSLGMILAGVFTWQYLHPTVIADRHRPVQIETKIERGLNWLKQALRPADLDAKVSSDCSPSKGDCLLYHLNQQLEKATPPMRVAGEPDIGARGDVRAALGWLLRSGGDADQTVDLIESPPHDTSTDGSSDPYRLASYDPFRLDGCLFIPPDGAPVGVFPHGAASGSACPGVTQVDSTKLEAPPNIDTLLRPARSYRRPLRAASPNRTTVQSPGLSTTLVQGRHVAASWNVTTQKIAAIHARCYTGDTQACAMCPDCAVAFAGKFHEGARGRSVGILVLDADGRIEAAASSMSRCYEMEHGGAARPSEPCPKLPDVGNPVETFRLLNQSIVNTAPAASEIKVPIAMALLKSGLLPAERAALPAILVHSKSADLIDIVLCRTQNFDNACVKRRIDAIYRTARNVGWIGDVDVLTDHQIAGLSYTIFGARLLNSDQSDVLPSWRYKSLPAAALRTCAEHKGENERYRNCAGADFINLVAELWGTSNAMATPVGIGNMWLNMVAAADGMTAAPRAHLVAYVQDAAGASIPVKPTGALATNKEDAQFVLAALARGHQEGTGHSACVAARKAAVSAGASWSIDCHGGVSVDPGSGPTSPALLLKIAGKSGTPKFLDKDSLQTLRKSCDGASSAFSTAAPRGAQWYKLRNQVADCGLRPYKWYTFALATSGSPRFNKVVVVLMERSFERGGVVDSQFDPATVPNVAAELGLAFANARWGQPDHKGIAP